MTRGCTGRSLVTLAKLPQRLNTYICIRSPKLPTEVVRTPPRAPRRLIGLVTMHRRVQTTQVVSVEDAPRLVKGLLQNPLSAAGAQALFATMVGAPSYRVAVAMLSQMPSSGDDSKVCGYVFREGDIAYNCKNCQADPTCVLCQTCFRNSDHTGEATEECLSLWRPGLGVDRVVVCVCQATKCTSIALALVVAATVATSRRGRKRGFVQSTRASITTRRQVLLPHTPLPRTAPARAVAVAWSGGVSCAHHAVWRCRRGR